MGTRGSFSGIKQPGREVKNAWSHTSLTQYASIAWFPVKKIVVVSHLNSWELHCAKQFLAFRSLASRNLFLKLKSSVISA